MQAIGMDGIYIVTAEEVRVVGVTPPLLALVFAADILECCGNSLRADIANKQITWNPLCSRKVVNEQKLLSLANHHNKKEVWQIYSFIKGQNLGSFFFILPACKNAPMTDEQRLNLKLLLISQNTGQDVEELRKSFNEFREHGVGDGYDIVACIDTTKGQKIGSATNTRCCRFCGKTISDGATFFKDPHAISRLLGNVSVLGLDECDECNGLVFGKMENSIANFFAALRPMLGVKGRHGLPEVKADKLSIKNATGHDVVVMIDSSLVTTIEDGSSLIQRFQVPCGKCVPLDIYRMLAKYAISVLSADEYDAKRFKSICDWIRNGTDDGRRLPLVPEQVTNRWNPKAPRIVVYKRRSDMVDKGPLYFCEFFAAGLRFFYELPFIEDSLLVDKNIWQDFIGKHSKLFGEDGWSYNDFSSSKEIDLVNNIILKGEKRISSSSGDIAVNFKEEELVRT